MEEIELKLEKVQSHGETFALILKEKNGARFLPVFIGQIEGRLIVFQQNRVALKRPIAHDLLLQLCEKTDCTVERILIDDYRDGIFYAHICLLRRGEALKIDSRVSDAVVISMKTGAPIFTLPAVLVAAGYTKDGPIGQAPPHFPSDSEDEVMLDTADNDDDDDDESDLLSEVTDFSLYTVEELTELLRQAVETENYEVAALIDAELNKRPDYAKEQ